jgi:hypothetical protein
MKLKIFLDRDSCEDLLKQISRDSLSRAAINAYCSAVPGLSIVMT